MEGTLVVMPPAQGAPRLPPPPQALEGRGNVAVDIILSILTCGIYNLFWQARQMRAVNAMLGIERFRFWPWFFLTLITCGIYHIYHEYVMGSAICEAAERLGRRVPQNLALISLLLSVFGLTIVTDAIQQHEINQILEG